MTAILLSVEQDLAGGNEVVEEIDLSQRDGDNVADAIDVEDMVEPRCHRIRHERENILPPSTKRS